MPWRPFAGQQPGLPDAACVQRVVVQIVSVRPDSARFRWKLTFSRREPGSSRRQFADGQLQAPPFARNIKGVGPAPAGSRPDPPCAEWSP